MTPPRQREFGRTGRDGSTETDAAARGEAVRGGKNDEQASWARNRAARNAAGAPPQPRPADGPPPPPAEPPRGGFSARGPHGEPRTGDGRKPQKPPA